MKKRGKEHNTVSLLEIHSHVRRCSPEQFVMEWLYGRMHPSTLYLHSAQVK